MAGKATTPAKNTPAPAPSPTGAQIVADAQRYLGSPYVFGGNPYTPGQLLTDCSGFVDRVFADLGAKLPGTRPTTTDLITMGSKVSSLAQAQPGDLIFLEGGDHVGIYMGNNKMIQDPQPGQAVDVVNVYQTPIAIRRLSGAGSATGTPAAGGTAAGSSSTGTAADLTSWLDSVAVRVGLVVLGGGMLLLGLAIAVPGHPIGQAAGKVAKAAAVAA